MKTDSIASLYRNPDRYSHLIDDTILKYLESLATIEDNNVQKRLLKELVHKYVTLENRVDALLKNTLPEEVAEEIKYEGKFIPREYECTILFSDFAGFTLLAEKIHGEVLIELLNKIFNGFDDIIAGFSGTKVKTIGDAYMAVFGAPAEHDDHAIMAVNAGLVLCDFIDSFNRREGQHFQMRVGIHTGRVMAGVVGKDRMQFDVFGDNVNIASRFESSGEKGKVNISHETYIRAQTHFAFEERGEISLKNKAAMKAYFVKGRL
jgi:class 3 adenylate cyclase